MPVISALLKSFRQKNSLSDRLGGTWSARTSTSTDTLTPTSIFAHPLFLGNKRSPAELWVGGWRGVAEASLQLHLLHKAGWGGFPGTRSPWPQRKFALAKTEQG